MRLGDVGGGQAREIVSVEENRHGAYLANPEKYASKSAPSLEFPKVPIPAS
jgi:hypothetical protein